METPLLIVGWSVRAAAQSALRGGFAPYAIDAFLDVDLQAAAPWSRKLTSWRELVDIVDSLPPCEWMYGGGLENHPDVVADLSRRHRLLGVGPVALRRVRGPFELAEVLARHGFAMPAMRRGDDAPNSVSGSGSSCGGRRWLLKRFASAGGIGVRPFTQGGPIANDCYFQEEVSGTVWGATYLATGGDCRMLGVCEQLSDHGDAGTPFRYQGSIGPIRIADAMSDALQRLGVAVAAEFELRGLFGVDLIVASDGAIRPIEVNPRYTASVELLERAYGCSMVDQHVRACRNELVSSNVGCDLSKLFGKQIVYYEECEPLVIAASAARRLAEWSRPGGMLGFADVPAEGTQIRPGDPIATVFAAAAEVEAVMRELAKQAERLREMVLSPN